MKLAVALLRSLVATGILIALLSVGVSPLPLLHWVYVLVSSMLLLTASAIMKPDLVKERSRPGRWMALQVLLMAHVVIASLDVGQFHLSDSVPFELRVVALLLFTGAYLVVIWAIAANPFFSTSVRIQVEREHRVASGGPYRYVRHPGYLGLAVGALSSALALGSWSAFGAAAVYAALLVLRARREEALLICGLPGYESYVREVTYRLIPRVY